MPLILISIGLIWLSVMTCMNMMHGYYGWFGSFLEHSQDTWSKEEVSNLLVRFGTSVRDRVGSQFLPLLLILAGTFLSAIQQRQDPKPKRAGPSNDG